MLYRGVLVVLSVLVLNGCQLQEPKTEATLEVAAEHVKKVKPIPKNCNAMPPLKDKAKLIDMLRKDGRINESMTDEQVDDVVNSYINKKQQAFKRCQEINRVEG